MTDRRNTKNQLGGFCMECGGTGRTETGCQSCPHCSLPNFMKNEKLPLPLEKSVSDELVESIKSEVQAHVELDAAMVKDDNELGGKVTVRVSDLSYAAFHYTMKRLFVVKG